MQRLGATGAWINESADRREMVLPCSASSSTALAIADGIFETRPGSKRTPGASLRILNPVISRLLNRFIVNLRISAMFAAVRLLPLVSRKYDVLGIRTYLALTNTDQFASVREQLDLSLGLIAQFDPARFARIRRDLKGILVYPFSIRPRAQYNRSFGYCELSTSSLMADDFVSTASMVVHEGTHARLRRIRSDDAERRVRIERICVAQEIAFLKKLPGMGARVDAARVLLASLKREDYTDAAVWADIFSEWKQAADAEIRRP